jgi:hypothetical protein
MQLSLKNGMVYCTRAGFTFVLSIEDATLISNFVDREVYFREDVMSYLNSKVSEGLIHRDVLANQQAIDSFLDDYIQMRADCGTSSGAEHTLNWKECLEEAFSENEDMCKYRSQVKENAQSAK